MQIKNSLIFILFSLLALMMSCHKEDNDVRDIYVALPAKPVKITNTAGTWLVYELHVKAASLEDVAIYHNDQLVLAYSDFITVEDLNIASVWIEYPDTGWPYKQLIHEFRYGKNASGEANKYIYNLNVETDYPEPKHIDFPVPKGIWLAEGAPGSNSYHTRALFPFQTPVYDPLQRGYLIGNNPQRFAIDYARLENGLPYKNDGKTLEDWHCYNMPILAAEGGRVLFIQSDIPDNKTPGKLDYPTDLTNATGNVVYIEHADGSIGTYCHLKENSIIVREGDVVNKGQELGKLGNSGNSFAPHLHLHVLDNPNGKKLTEYSDGLFMESLPYSFAAFVKLGALPVDYLTQEPIVPFVPTMERDCRDMLPAESDVIAF